jgi:hypothetical protein
MTPTEGADVVLPLSGGNPLFVAKAQGTGRIILSAIPLDGAWSELPLSPQFVPFVQRTLQWLSGSVDAPASLTPGESWRVRVPSINVGRPFYVRTPSTEGAAQPAGQVEFQSGQAIVAYSDTGRLGRYQIYLDPEEAPVGTFGVNLPPDESDLRIASPEIFADLGASALDSSRGEASTPGIFSRVLSTLPDLWVLLVFILLITGGIGLYLAQRFSRTE